MPKDSIQLTLNQLMNMTSDARNNVIINSTVKDTVGTILNSIEDDNIKLKADNIKVIEKYDNKNVDQQKDIRNKGQIWANDLRADIQLIDKKTNKVIDKVSNMKVVDIPKITDRGSFLIGGVEYQFTKQARLKPGVYTQRQKNGEISSFFNVDKTIDFERGFNNNFRLGFDPEKKVFMMTYGTKNIPLINALRTIGVTNQEMSNSWGKDVFDVNSQVYDKHQEINQNKLYEAVFGKQPAKELNIMDISKQIKERLFATQLDPDITQITLGKPYKEVNKQAILDASKKIIDINRGVVEPDDRESLIFKSFYDTEDHIREKLVKNSDKIISNIKYKLNKNKSIKRSLSPQTFNHFIVGTITNSSLSSPPSQINPIAMLGEGSKFTVMGDGGIGSANAITNEARQISNSELSFVDPLHTPEGGTIGVVNHMTMDTIKVGNDLYSKFLDTNGKNILLRPIDVYNKNIAFPDQFTIKNGKPHAIADTVKAVKAGKIIEINKKDIDYVIPNAIGMFDTSVNSIPFLDSIQGNRGLTAAKMQEQALSLKYREKPLFKILDGNGKPLAENLAKTIALPRSPVDGSIKNVTDDKITIEDKKGKSYEIPIYNNFSLNSESFLHNEPKVKRGDNVKVGDVLADNNFTKDGQLALGANLRVAYLPYRGYNFEDSAIISESAAKKLTSQHIYDLKAKRTSKGIFSANKYKAYYPEELNAKNRLKLDKDGIILPGQKVDRGDIVIAHLEKKSPTADDLAIGRLDKQLKRDMSDHAVRWENDHTGIVTDVKKIGNSVVVNVKTEEPLKVADKISGLHGNKHIISVIVPDDQMPFDPKTGKHIDLTMSPIGVSNRINTSQILESAAGKIAEKTGEQYPVKNFTPTDNSRKILEELKSHGLSDKDILIDPVTKKPYKNPVATGIAHIIKLEHKVDHKFSARHREGYDSNEQPVSGGETGAKNLGRMELAALIARGANENIKEMFSIKGQRNDEYWKAMETGQSLPAPKSSFVWDKMLAMMNGAGINVEQKGKTFTLKPMTDAEIIEKSKGELLKPTDTYRFKDLAPMKEGLFDPVKAGGIFGEHYTHFKLPEKTLNPITATAASILTDLPLIKLEEVIAGKSFIEKNTGKIVKPGTPNSVSGGPALEILLGAVNVKEDLKQSTSLLEQATNPVEINKLNKKIKYLRALEKNGMKPTDYLIQNVLVPPSKYRPIFSLGEGNAVITSDVNDLYQQTAHTANALKDLKIQLNHVLKDEDIKNLQLAEARGQLYNDLKTVTGLQEPTSYLNRVHDKKGFISQIDGGKKQTKEGYYQDKVLGRRQDIVGRSTIIVNPNLSGDELGVPKNMATQIFKPFIMKKMVSWGYSPLEAQKQIEDKTQIFDRARQVVADEKLVIANRAPSLHRWNMTAFKPKLIEGKSIEVPSIVVVGNFSGDYDGDCNIGEVILSMKINNKNNNFGIDFTSGLTYINGDNFKAWFQQRKINMPNIATLPVHENEKFIHINIADFPRLEETKKIEPNGNIVYKVPNGIKIITCDEKANNIITVPVTEFSIHVNLKNCIIKLSNRDDLLVSEDESLIGINTDTWKLERLTPNTIIGKAIPKIQNINISPSIFEINIKNFSQKNRNTVSTISIKKLDKNFGYLLGLMVGDGWIAKSRPDQITIANVDDDLLNAFSNEIDKLLEHPIKLGITESPHNFNGYSCFSKKGIKSSIALGPNFWDWIGEGAENKHLPSFYISSPEEFRLGLLSGLIDTDGSISWSNGGKRKKPQMIFNITTISSRLAMEVISLCRSLGISSNITEYRNAYCITLSARHMYGKSLILNCANKKKNFEEFNSQKMTESSVSARMDLVPVSNDLFQLCRDIGLNSNLYHIEYCSMNNGIKSGAMPRVTAKKIIEIVKKNKLPKEWIDIVNNENITWVYAKEVVHNKNRITMYDITAPGPYTFMLNNGIIVQDTFQLHVPISAKATAEAEKMKPSASMLKSGYDSVLNLPSLDMTIGSWLVSKGKGGIDTKLKFDTIEQARIAYRQNKFDHADTIKIGDIKAPYGMHEINSVVPDESKKWNIELTKNNSEDWIRDVTKKYNGKIALGLADKIKEVGSDYATDFGFTLGVSDTVSDKKLKERLIQEANKRIKRGDKESIVKAYAEVLHKGRKALEDMHGENTMLGIGIKSGGSKGIENTSAITFMPGIVTDANEHPIPIPITNSYSEGLDTAGYWTAAHGARGGNIKKSISSYLPGWMTKDLTNSLYETRIASEEPMDTQGIEYDISDKKGISNRYLAQDVKTTGGKIVAKRNELIDSDVINKLNQHKIKSIFVQSPLTDPTPNDGFSSWSYGADFNKKKPNIGDAIGIMSAHTVTEPALNWAMKAFHTGGALNLKQKSVGTIFDQLFDTLKFAKSNPDKATLSNMNGKVIDIKKSSIGGWDVVLDNGNKKEVRYIDANNEPIVKKGDKVSPGDQLSSGMPSAHDILKYKGMPETQRFLVNRISDITDKKLDKRDIETIVRGLTNTTRILDPGSHSYFVKGDVAPLTAINFYNNKNKKEVDIEDSLGTYLSQDYRNLKAGTKINKKDIDVIDKYGFKRIFVNKDLVKHEPFLVPQGIQAKPKLSEDWLARLSHNRLDTMLMEATTQGWKSGTSDQSHPLNKYITGQY